MQLKIQPKAISDMMHEPFPYFIDCQTEMVLKQDFWKGKPQKLLCFTDIKCETMIFLRDAMENPELIKKLFPAFQDSNGEQYTMTSKYGFEYKFLDK